MLVLTGCARCFKSKYVCLCVCGVCVLQAARVEFARSRMVFAMRVQREKQQPTLIAVTRSPCGRYSSAPTILGQQQLTWHSGDGTSETYQTQGAYSVMYM